jgi:hypothetical protein
MWTIVALGIFIGLFGTTWWLVKDSQRRFKRRLDDGDSWSGNVP